MPADGSPPWLQVWRGEPQHAQSAYAPRDGVQFARQPGVDLQGFIEPRQWAFDGCVRREPVMDVDYPPRVVRKIGWQRCMKCNRPFFSDDVIRRRLCSPGAGMIGCRGDPDRFT